MTDTALEQHYAQLWHGALHAWHHGTVALDPLLTQKQNDQRRGFTLILRPTPAMAHQFARFLAAVAAVEPSQYYYRPSEFHITVLSLFTATAAYQPYVAHQAAYLRAIDQALAGTHRFALHFRGITASPGAIMVQGFPCDDTLDGIRQRVRQELRRAGVGSGLDQRYPITTAHATVVRFQQPFRHLHALLHCLQRYRAHDFGAMAVDAIQFVANDWYMSAEKVCALRQYPLG